LRRLAALFALTLCACGNPDNQVFGGISGGTLAPDAFLDNVGSAIAGVSKVADQNGNLTSIDVFILTDRTNLCAKLANTPDYFRNPPEAYVALVMSTPQDRLGTFVVGASNGGGSLLMVTAGPGKTITSYPGGAGSVSVTNFDSRAGGEATGTFDILFADSLQVGHEIFGKFKTSTCPALANVTF
jgi:hypothetical protein